MKFLSCYNNFTERRYFVKTAIYAGSFDPFTNGHLDILETSAKIFDKVIILVADNSQKNYILPVETRLDLIRQSISHLQNAEADYFDGLTVEYAKKKNATVLIRGLRTSSDFEYESQMAKINKSLAPDITTVFIPATKENDYISSSMIRELLLHKKDISQFVPDAINEYFTNNPVC